jgi:hypothetical protein
MLQKGPPGVEEENIPAGVPSAIAILGTVKKQSSL